MPATRDELRAAIDSLSRDPEIGAAIGELSADLARRVMVGLAGDRSAVLAIEDECRRTIVEAICIGMGSRNRKLADRIAEGMKVRLPPEPRAPLLARLAGMLRG